MLFFQIVITGLFSGLLQLTAHLIVLMYCPKLDMVPRYIIGTLGLLLPPSVFLLLTELDEHGRSVTVAKAAINAAKKMIKDSG